MSRGRHEGASHPMDDASDRVRAFLDAVGAEHRDAVLALLEAVLASDVVLFTQTPEDEE